MDDLRLQAVKQSLFEYLKSPSLKHIRDPYSVNRLAQEILKQVDRTNSTWRKWDGPREALLKSALLCWVPLDDIRAFLNGMPGQPLTLTDVEQRFKAFENELLYFANDELREGCITLYEREKAAGTELPAIIGCITDRVEQEEERLRREGMQRCLEDREKKKVEREERLLSGADCGWTQVTKPWWHCRVNGQTYRLEPTKDGLWRLHRLKDMLAQPGAILGIYKHRTDAAKAVRLMAYQ